MCRGYLCRHLRFLARLAERFGRERYDGGVNFYNFTLPVMTMAVYGTGYIARMTRASMVEVMSQQYIRTARLKGLSFGAVVLEACVAQRLDCAVHRHHAADSLLLTGVAVVENMFRYQGSASRWWKRRRTTTSTFCWPVR
jgi:ABC-type dipeptide/oligopeptide/nickel transport system permease component